MKYFTRKLAEGKVTEKSAESLKQKYLDTIYEIREQLPSSLRELAFENLRGARVLKLKIDKTNKIMQVKLETEEGNLDLTYDTLQLEDTNVDILEACAKDPKTQILFDEIGIGESGYTHSFLFAPEDEACITFRSLRVRKK
jgi:hypothetical protein